MSSPAHSIRVKPDLEFPFEVRGSLRSQASLEPFRQFVDRITGDDEAFKSRLFDFALVARWNADRLAYDVVELTIMRADDQTPITSAALRHVRVAEVLEAVIRREVHTATGARAMHEFWSAADRADPGKRDQLLLSVARQYAIARAAGAPPLVEVAIAVSASQSTATRLVAEARRRGLLD